MATTNSSDITIEQLRSEWQEMFQTKLPLAAVAKSPTQPAWPVHNDHCFARIILDTTIGKDVPWPSKITSPAYTNMSRKQLQACIELGQRILDGEVDLVELDEKSLGVRGKTKAKGLKRKGMAAVNDVGTKKDAGVLRQTKKMRVTPRSAELLPPSIEPTQTTPSPSPSPTSLSTTSKPLTAIPPHDPPLTPHQTLVLTTLLQVPLGQYTTYGLLAAHLHSSPRAVGNALRNNPFAPQVPCHRVVASDGTLGGFKGSWGRGVEGSFDEEKRRLLRGEGVRFDGRGRVVGVPWKGFK